MLPFHACFRENGFEKKVLLKNSISKRNRKRLVLFIRDLKSILKMNSKRIFAKKLSRGDEVFVLFPRLKYGHHFCLLFAL